ncbi:MAG TPA: hypothetical protein VNA57_06105 [Acidimicrobiales bacterium]|nr:hypothetical protein [Acidimicrobiales bacterium]
MALARSHRSCRPEETGGILVVAEVDQGPRQRFQRVGGDEALRADLGQTATGTISSVERIATTTGDERLGDEHPARGGRTGRRRQPLLERGGRPLEIPLSHGGPAKEGQCMRSQPPSKAHRPPEVGGFLRGSRGRVLVTVRPLEEGEGGQTASKREFVLRPAGLTNGLVDDGTSLVMVLAVRRPSPWPCPQPCKGRGRQHLPDGRGL